MGLLRPCKPLPPSSTPPTNLCSTCSLQLCVRSKFLSPPKSHSLYQAKSVKHVTAEQQAGVQPTTHLNLPACPLLSCLEPGCCAQQAVYFDRLQAGPLLTDKERQLLQWASGGQNVVYRARSVQPRPAFNA